MTRKQNKYQWKTPCLPVQILFTTHFNDFWAISFSFFSMLLKLSTFIAGCDIISFLKNLLFVLYTHVSLYIYIV